MSEPEPIIENETQIQSTSSSIATTGDMGSEAASIGAASASTSSPLASEAPPPLSPTMPPLPPADNNNTANVNTHINTNTNKTDKMLRVIARMYRQHSDLFLNQAIYLEKMSLNMNGSDSTSSSQWESNDNQIATATLPLSLPPPLPPPVPIPKAPPSREELLSKIRRESVIDLAKKSYEGMREVKSFMNSIVANKEKTKLTREERKMFAHELFEQDILRKIVREDEYQKLTKGKHWNKQGGYTGTGTKQKQANAYVFKRTQEEWINLSKQKRKIYARLAKRNNDVERFQIPKKRKRSSGRPDSSNANAATTVIAMTTPKRKRMKKEDLDQINRVSAISKSDNSGGNNDDDNSNNNSSSDSNSGSSSSSDNSSSDSDSSSSDNDSDSEDDSVASIVENQSNESVGDDSEKSAGDDIGSNDEDDEDNMEITSRFELPILPPIPKSTIKHRERDE